MSVRIFARSSVFPPVYISWRWYSPTWSHFPAWVWLPFRYVCLFACRSLSDTVALQPCIERSNEREMENNIKTSRRCLMYKITIQVRRVRTERSPTASIFVLYQGKQNAFWRDGEKAVCPHPLDRVTGRWRWNLLCDAIGKLREVNICVSVEVPLESLCWKPYKQYEDGIGWATPKGTMVSNTGEKATQW